MTKTEKVCFLEKGIDPALLERFGTSHDENNYVYFPKFETKPKIMRVDVKKVKTSESDFEIRVVYLEQVIRFNHPNGNTNVVKYYKYSEFESVLRAILSTKKGKYYAEMYPKAYKKLSELATF